MVSGEDRIDRLNLPVRRVRIGAIPLLMMSDWMAAHCRLDDAAIELCLPLISHSSIVSGTSTNMLCQQFPVRGGVSRTGNPGVLVAAPQAAIAVYV